MPDMDAYMLRQLREEAARKAKEVEEEALKNPGLKGVVVRPRIPDELPSPPAEETDLSVDKYAALGQVPEELLLEVPWPPLGALVEKAARKVLTKK
jgi:hypothetical protein